MSEVARTNAVLLVADVTASVALYERLGDAQAFATIAGILDRLNGLVETGGGHFIQSRGDDLLCAFEDAEAAVSAAQAMLSEAEAQDVAIHIALHAGEAILARASIFGDAVNVAYRLANIANAGEALASGEAVALLPAGWQSRFRRLRAFRFKGRAEPVEVLAYSGPPNVSQTQLPPQFHRQDPGEAVALHLRYGGQSWWLSEADSFTIGRDDDVDLQIAQPWVSRRHASFLIRDGLALLTDRSTYGSFLSQPGSPELRVRRTSVTLTGAGSLSLGIGHDQPEAQTVTFEVRREPAKATVA